MGYYDAWINKLQWLFSDIIKYNTPIYKLKFKFNFHKIIHKSGYGTSFTVSVDENKTKVVKH